MPQSGELHSSARAGLGARMFLGAPPANITIMSIVLLD
jgi:hypothetical protein